MVSIAVGNYNSIAACRRQLLEDTTTYLPIAFHEFYMYPHHAELHPFPRRIKAYLQITQRGDR